MNNEKIPQKESLNSVEEQRERAMENVKQNPNDVANVHIKGHLFITDKNTGEVLLDKNNAIHFENMSLALARSLGHKSTGPIEKIFYGNGGSTVNGIGEVTYLPPNTVGQSASLYNATYSKIVDDLSSNNNDTDNNKVEISHVSGNLFSDLVVTTSLDFGEPSGQDNFDSTSSTESNFVFDEIGLVDYSGNMLTHIVFSPIQKSLNREIEVKYTLRIQMV